MLDPLDALQQIKRLIDTHNSPSDTQNLKSQYWEGWSDGWDDCAKSIVAAVAPILKEAGVE